MNYIFKDNLFNINDSCHLQKSGHFSWVNSCCLYLEAFGIDSDLSKLKNMRPKQFKVLVNRALRNSFERYWTDGIKSKFGQSSKRGNKLRIYATYIIDGKYFAKFWGRGKAIVSDKSTVSFYCFQKTDLCSNQNLGVITFLIPSMSNSGLDIQREGGFFFYSPSKLFSLAILH